MIASENLRRAAEVVGLAAVYFGAAILGLSLATVAPQVTAVWPPTGIALAAVLLRGYRVWPGIVLGALLANLMADATLPVAAGIAAGNTLEALAGAWLLRRRPGFDLGLRRVQDALSLVVLAAVASTTVSATIGTASLCVGGLQPWGAFGRLWWVWWLGDALGALVVAPAVLVWASEPRSPRRRPEATALVLALAAVSWLVYGERLTWTMGSSALAYSIFPIIIWAALRFGRKGATAVTLAASALAIWGTAQGLGPFGTAPLHEGLLLLQSFMAVMAVTALLLAAVLAERRRAEREAQQTAARLELALQAGNMGTWEWDLATNAVAWSPGLEAIHGLAPGTFDGTFAGYARDVHPEDRDRVREALERSVAEGGEFECEYRIVLPDGRRRWVEGRGRPTRDAAGPLRMTGVCIDITARRGAEEALRASEERSRSVVDHVIDGIITIDQHGVIASFNPAAERIFGYASAEVVGQNVKLLMPEPYRSEHDGYLANYLRTGEARIIGIGREVVGRRRDGSTFPLDLAVSRFQLDGRPYFTGVVRDITQRRQLEAELHRRIEELAEADRRKNEFLAMLAHELRNPLAPILTAVEILRRRGAGDPALARSAEVIQRQARQLTRLVDELLDISRISRGTVRLHPEPVSLADVVARAVETVRPALDARRHQLEVSLPEEPIWLEADPARLDQVLSNLLDNAAKFTPDGGRIALTAARSGSEALVTVRDSGIGMAPEFLPRAFDAFTQADASLARTHGGLGLGLTLSRRLVELHGGTIAASSAGPGQGSEFVVRLPAAAAPRQAAPPSPAPRAAAAARRVLVVDDSVDAAESLAQILRLAGHEARTAHDGPAALAGVSEFHPEVVLLDIGLPEMDGYEVARRLRQLPETAGALLVALTGYGHEEHRRRSREAGFDAHLVKPVDFDAMHALLARPPGTAPG